MLWYPPSSITECHEQQANRAAQKCANCDEHHDIVFHHAADYKKLSNNVTTEIKPIGTLQDFSATHLGHSEWDITRLFSRTNFLVEDVKIFLRARCARFLSPPVLTLVLVFFGENFLSRRYANAQPSGQRHETSSVDIQNTE